MIEREPRKGSFTGKGFHNTGSPLLNTVKLSVKGFVAFELFLFGAAFYYHRKLSTSEELRRQWHTDHPKRLEVYYQIGEVGGYNTRKVDYKNWGVKFPGHQPDRD